MNGEDQEFWDRVCQDLIEESQRAISPLIGSPEWGNSENGGGWNTHHSH
nr:hypothetical protein [Methanobacterium formicicum]